MKNKTSVQKQRTDRVRIASGLLGRYSKDKRYPKAARKAFDISSAMIKAAYSAPTPELDRLREGLARLRDTTSCTKGQYAIIDELLAE